MQCVLSPVGLIGPRPSRASFDSGLGSASPQHVYCRLHVKNSYVAQTPTCCDVSLLRWSPTRVLTRRLASLNTYEKLKLEVQQDMLGAGVVIACASAVLSRDWQAAEFTLLGCAISFAYLRLLVRDLDSKTFVSELRAHALPRRLVLIVIPLSLCWLARLDGGFHWACFAMGCFSLKVTAVRECPAA